SISEGRAGDHLRAAARCRPAAWGSIRKHPEQPENLLSLVLATLWKLIAVIQAGFHCRPRQTIKCSVALLVALLSVRQNIPQIHPSLIPDSVVSHRSGFEQFDEKGSGHS